MSDTDTLATPPASETTTPAAPVNDGIIDLDADNQVQVEAEDEDQPKDGETEKAGDEKPAEEDKPKKLSGAQRAKIREQRLASENADLQRRLEEATKKAPAPDASEDKPPREEDYNGDWFAFQRALTAYDAGKEVRKELQKDRETRETSERATQQANAAKERQTAHMERVEAAREVIADFDEAMKEMDGVQVRQDVIEEIMSSDKSAEISYFLAKNPDKLDALNSMSGRELAREMGRLEATVKMPEAKRATTAPAPFSRPRGGAAPSSVDADLQAYLNKTYGDRRK